VSDSFDIRYLGKREINALINNLEKYNCLGILKDKPREEQVKAFNETQEDSF
jgi:hypothetical protein